MKAKKRKDDVGSVAIVAMALCSVALVLGLGLLKLGSFTSIKAKAQNAADSASLSAAYDIAHFSANSACSSAENAANKNGAILDSCDYTNNNVEVIVSIDHLGKKVQAKAKAEIK